jgi:hypothetical protein
VPNPDVLLLVAFVAVTASYALVGFVGLNIYRRQK